MLPDEATILCGEWETGPTPPRFSKEKYNVGLKITEIVRHPDFDANLGVEGGNDIAVFKVVKGGLANSSFLDINPICLPEPDRPKPKEGVQSGWSKPPPLYYFKEFGEGFLSFITDTFKQWHYKMKIQDECKEPSRTEAFDTVIEYPSKAYYPPGLICAKDVTSRFCPTAGDSGSPLMVQEEKSERFYLEGLLSYLKGCDKFSFQQSNRVISTYKRNPACDTCTACTQNCEYTFACYSCKEFPTVWDGQTVDTQKQFSFLSFTESPLAR